MDQIEGPWSPEEDEMLRNLIGKHGSNWPLISKSISGRSGDSCWSRLLSLYLSFTPEEDRMLQNLVEKHGHNWSLISNFIPGTSANTCRLRWLFVHRPFTPEEDETNYEDITISDRNYFLHKVCYINRVLGKMARDNVSQPSAGMPTFKRTLFPFSGHERPQQIYTTATSETLWNLNTNGTQGNSRFHFAMETRSQNSIHQGNSGHEVGGVVSGHQPPSISDLARDNMSLGDTHSYSREQSAPSWDAFNKRDSWSMMIASNNVQEFMGDEFGSQNSIHQGNSSHEVRGMVSGQAPSISDMARGNMSSGGTHSYSRDHSAPSWNALYKRDSSPMMIDSYSVQQFVGSEFGRNDFWESSSRKGMVTNDN